MRFAILTVFAGLLVSVASAQDNSFKYALNGENTKILWSGTKANGKHDGGFKTVHGSATLSEVAGLKIDVEIDTTSLYSDDAKLTGHLKSPDFFAVKDHPKARFVSTKIDKTGANTYNVQGDLTLLGKTKQVNFPATITAGNALQIAASFKIKRADYGMTYGIGKIDDDVSIQVSVNASK
ncbi:MAG: YceI family protein [Gemmataceae bacterium]|nr:YceI family protein [Gemmataceae bacterium]